MKKKYSILLVLLWLLNPILAKSQINDKGSSSLLGKISMPVTNQKFGTSGFEENKGQLMGSDAQDVHFIYSTQGLKVFLLKTGIAYQFSKTHLPAGYEGKIFDKTIAYNSSKEESEKINNETYRMDLRLIDANPNAEIIKDGKSIDYINYYNRNALNVHSFSKITYKEIYHNIDWVIYQSDDHIKYDFIVKPGGDPSLIKLHIDHAEAISLNADGCLIMENRMGNIIERTPVSYQEGKLIKTGFTQIGNNFSFNLANYNNKKTLIIDPVLQWATYYGNEGMDMSYGTTTDTAGNVYMTGITYSVNSIASGGYQNSFGGGEWDAFLVKFNNNCQRLWATYYGSNGSDYGAAVTVDKSGNVYMGGYSSSWGIAYNGFQDTASYAGDGILVKFNSAGTRLWATYYGGYGFDGFLSCVTDSSGNIYAAGFTSSPNNISFNGYQNDPAIAPGSNYYRDAMLVKFDSAGNRIWGTYYGGIGSETAYACRVNKQGQILIVGQTSSPEDMVSANAMQTTYGGASNSSLFMDGGDAFIAKFNNDGSRQWASYYGGDKDDVGMACAFDKEDNIYMTGFSLSENGISYNGFQNTYGGDSTLFGIGAFYWGDAYLVKFDSSGQRLWATYYGGVKDDAAYSCDVDTANNIIISGSTISVNDIAYNGFKNELDSASGSYESPDIFIARFNQTGQRQWGTYYGGDGWDVINSIAVDKKGSLYLAGATSSLANFALNGFQNGLSNNTNQDFDACLMKIFLDCHDAIIATQPIAQQIYSDNDTGFFIINSVGSDYYQWQIETPSGFQNITDAIHFSAVNNDSLCFFNLPLSYDQSKFRCLVSVVNGCSVTASDTVKLSVNQNGLSINSIEPVPFIIYPNPANSYFIMEGLQKGDLVEIVDMDGTIQAAFKVANEGKIKTNISSLIAGVYIVRINRGVKFWNLKLLKY